MDETTVGASSREGPRAAAPTRTCPALAIAWYVHEPGRVGEVALFPESGGAVELGRGAGEGAPRVSWARQRPGWNEPQPPLGAPGLSRRQLLIEPARAGLRVTQLGKCPLTWNGAPAEGTFEIAPGDVLSLEAALTLVCVQRPELVPSLRSYPIERVAPFGEPDADGMVGESPAAWHLRESIAFAARGEGHVLVTGPVGSGKEVVARTVHALSARRDKPYVVRGYGTLPFTLIDAELFGNVADQPTPGVAARPGLLADVGEGTLVLDDLDRFPWEAQSRLPRVLETGEYKRVGEDGLRTTRARMVASATVPERIDPAVRARFSFAIEVPGLGARIEDVPLIAQRLLMRTTAKNPELVKPYIDAEGNIRLGQSLVVKLLRHAFVHHVRELEAMVTRAIGMSEGGELVASRPRDAAPAPGAATPRAPSLPAPALPRERISLVREGEVWLLRVDGAEGRFKDSKGFVYLEHLIRRPGVEVHCLDLVLLTDPPPPAERDAPPDAEASSGNDDAGPVLDARARQSIKERLESLRAELEDAEERGSADRADALREEMEALARYLGAGTGLGGRERRSGSSQEKARINVQRRIRDAIARVEAHDKEMARFLSDRVQTGTFCTFTAR